MLRAIIIDDEPIGVAGLRVMLEKHCPEVKVIGVSTDPEQGLQQIEDFRPDVVFLDVAMPKMDGFELLERLSFQHAKIVFTTAHREHAIRAIRRRAADYLLKPIDIQDLKDCVKHLLADSESQGGKTHVSSLIELPVREGIIFIKQTDVVRLEASGSYTTFFLDNGVKHIASKNLKECETKLDPDLFYRCHASHLINLRKVERMVSTDGLFARMVDGSMVEIARKNKETFLGRLKDLKM